MSNFEFVVGDESGSQELLPVVDRVIVRLVSIEPNKYNNENKNKKLDFGFRINDPEYDGGDEDDNEVIRRLSDEGYIHYERPNLPEGADVGKRTRMYFFMKGFNGGKDIEKGQRFDFGDYLNQDFYADFEHADKKGGPPDFAVQLDGNGRPIKKSTIAKLRPVRKAKAKATPVVVDPEDEDVFEEDDD